MGGWCLLLLLGCAAVRVEGVVQDGHSHLPIAGAVVRIGARETTCDQQGRYALAVLPKRTPLPVSVRALGFREALGERPIQAGTAQPIHFHFELTPVVEGDPEGPEWRGLSVALPASLGRGERVR